MIVVVFTIVIINFTVFPDMSGDSNYHSYYYHNYQYHISKRIIIHIVYIFM